MSAVERRIVEADDDGIRLDRWFKRHFPAIPHGALEKLLRTGQIRVDGARAKASIRLVEGQEIRIPPLAKTGAAPTKAASEADLRDNKDFERFVLFRNEILTAINKPPGLAVQGGTGTPRHLDRMLAARARATGERLRLVHRLDRDTSGVLALARTPAAASLLTKAFKDRETRKLYWALTSGVPNPPQGRIDLALVKKVQSARGGKEMMAPAEDEDEEAQRAITDYQVLDIAGPVAFVALQPVTGRTHQLRAHLAALGTPILGDLKYGGEAARIEGALPDGLMLHARRLTIQAGAGRPVSVEAPLPPAMAEAFALLGFDPKDPRDPFG